MKWIPVTERLPEPHQPGMRWSEDVLVYDRDYSTIYIAAYDHVKQRWADGQNDPYPNPSHWMPLPDVPEATNG